MRGARVVALCALAAVGCAVRALSPPGGRIVIVGGGPSALFFANLHLRAHPEDRVRIVEQGEDPRLSPQPASAFGFGLGTRARDILGRVPGLVDKVNGISAFVDGNTASLGIVNRAHLGAVLLEAAAEDDDVSSRLEVTFGARAGALDRNRRVVHTTSADGSNEAIPYTLLVGADGVRSGVRAQLEAAGDVAVERYERNARWKALPLPPQPDLAPGAFVPLQGAASLRPKAEFGAVLPRFGGGHTALLFWRFRPRDLERPAAAQKRNPWGAETAADLRGQLAAATGGAVSAFPSDRELEGFLERGPGREMYVKASRFHDGGCVALLGDAAAGMYSLLGQGCVCGLYSAEVLARSLDAHRGDLRAALATYDGEALPESHAITDLNLLAHLLDSPLGMIAAAPLFLAAKLRGQQSVLRQMNERNMPYSRILAQNRALIALAKVWWRRNRVPLDPHGGG